MILLVCHEKGGVGKSSIAVNLAAMFAFKGVPTLLLDTDTNGSAVGWLRTREEVQSDPPPARISSMALTTANPAMMVAEQAAHYKVVIIDVAAGALKTMYSVAKQADFVLVPCQAGQYEVGSTQRIFADFEGMNHLHIRGQIPAHVVLNNMPTNSRSKEVSETRDFLRNECGIKVLDTVLRSRKSWRESSKEGLGVFELAGGLADPKAAAELEELFNEILSIVSAPSKGA